MHFHVFLLEDWGCWLGAEHRLCSLGEMWIWYGVVRNGLGLRLKPLFLPRVSDPNPKSLFSVIPPSLTEQSFLYTGLLGRTV